LIVPPMCAGMGVFCTNGLEVPMPKQRWLPWRGPESLEELWERFPEDCRRSVVSIYARLIERAVRPPESHERKDERDESSEQ
jgi:hypothetical protein